MIYVIGSLRNPKIPEVSAALREHGFEVFDDWFAAGPHADDAWRDYEKGRGRALPEALNGHAAENVFRFDHRNLSRASSVVLVLPAGKSAHLEFGWCLGQGKTGVILLDQDPERYDVMYKFADAVATTIEDVAGAVEPTERRAVCGSVNGRRMAGGILECGGSSSSRSSHSSR